jgi:hypothetical protein
MIVVIVVMIVVAALAGAIMVSTLTGVRGGSASASRSVSQRTVEDATEIYRVALESGLANESTGWVPPPTELQKLLGTRGTLVDVASLTSLPAALRQPIPGAPRQAVRMSAQSGSSHRYWQLVRIVGPGHGATDGNVTVWIRGWQASATGMTTREPVVKRVSLSPGAFHHFQLLVDGPIRFDSGARITGPVHSNGRNVGGGSAISTVSGAAVTCSGEFARLSTGDGSIGGEMPAGCRRITKARSWSFGSVRQTLDRIQVAGASGGSGVFVASPADNGAVPVRLNGTSVDVGGVVRPVGGGLTVLVLGNVVVSGQTSGRVTIASNPPGATAGEIKVDGDLRTSGAAAAIGLFTEGDVVVSTSPCVGRIDAAIISARGSLTIDRGLRTELAQLDAARCGSIAVVGSIAAAESPVLRWAWPNGITAGYAARSYDWNPRLVRTPPPWTPVIEGWQVRDQQDVVPTCGRSGSAVGCT